MKLKNQVFLQSFQIGVPLNFQFFEGFLRVFFPTDNSILPWSPTLTRRITSPAWSGASCTMLSPPILWQPDDAVAKQSAGSTGQAT